MRKATEENPDPFHDKERLWPYEPSVGVRLAWWLAIYFGPQIPFGFEAPIVFALFPLGIIDPLVPSDARPDNALSASWALSLAFGIYLTHLIMTLLVRRAITFRIMLVSLAIMIVLNFAGCSLMFHRLSLNLQ